jgi:hypothetical protein
VTVFTGITGTEASQVDIHLRLSGCHGHNRQGTLGIILGLGARHGLGCRLHQEYLINCGGDTDDDHKPEPSTSYHFRKQMRSFYTGLLSGFILLR